MRGQIAAPLTSIGRWFANRRRQLRRNAAVSQSEAGLASLLEEAPVPCHEMDREGVIQRVNQAECELLGCDRTQMVGHPVWDFVAPEAREASRLAVARKMAGEQALAPFLRRYRRGDGSQVTVEIHETFVRDGRGKVAGIRSALLDATSRQRTEQALENSEASYRNLFENTPIGIYRTTPDGRILMANPALLEMLGYSSLEELAAHHLERGGYAPTYDRAEFLAAFEGGGEVKGHEAEWVCRDGTKLLIRENARAIRDGDGAVIFFEGTIEDVTGRKHAEEALRQANAVLEAIARASPLAVVVLDLNGNVRDWNPAAEKMFGFTAAEVLGCPAPHIPPGEVAEFRRRLAAAAEETQPAAAEIPFRRKDGSTVEAALWTAPLRNSRGEVEGVVGILADITERKRDERALHQANETLKMLIQACPLRIMVLDLGGNVQSWNARSERDLGWTQGETLGRPLPLVTEVDREGFAEYLEAIKAGHIFEGVEKRVRRKDGSELDISLWAAPLRNPRGEIVGSVTAAADITERKQNERKLRESEERYRELFENAYDIVYAIDLQGQFTALNRAAERTFGYSREEALGKNAGLFMSPRARARFPEQIAAMLAGGSPVRDETTVLAKDGREVLMELSSRLVFDKGQPVGIQGMGRDITERKRHQEELARYARELQQKNEELSAALVAASVAAEAKSRFLANMSHEIRTPMNGVTGMLDLLLATSLSAEQQECARFVQASSEALLAVINDILEFSSMEGGKLALGEAPFELAAVVNEVCALLGVQARRKGLQLHSHLDPSLPRMLSGDAPRLRQIMSSLLGNAIKFTEAGEVAVHVSLERGTARTATIRVTVRDTGIGIDPEQCAELFNSFVQGDDSAARKYGGSGLGLAISKQLVEMMGGRIGFESEAGLGSTFWFTARFQRQAPRKATEAPAAAVEPRPPLAVTASVSPADVCVLVAEDNEVNQRIALRMLEKSGFRAHVVPDGRQAAEAALSGQYDVVLMDVHMPGMDGFAATAEIRGRERNGGRLPIVAMTARAMAGDREECLAAGMDDYLTKPIQMENLRRTVLRWAGIGHSRPRPTPGP
jgi:PAS domain S-box-containing protein